ncbi:MAG: hypothetical protein ACE5GJ_06930 [Gemmatimonadota bacterium]
MRASYRRGGFSSGDLLLLVAVLSVLTALAFPYVLQARQTLHATEARRTVSLVHSALLQFRKERGRWPEEDPAGGIPAELRPLLPADALPSSGPYHVEWRRWELVQRPPPPEPAVEEADTVAPPAPWLLPLGLLRLTSGHDPVLAALLEEYGPARSFVRDSTWTLVLPATQSAPPGTP